MLRARINNVSNGWLYRTARRRQLDYATLCVDVQRVLESATASNQILWLIDGADQLEEVWFLYSDYTTSGTCVAFNYLTLACGRLTHAEIWLGCQLYYQNMQRLWLRSELVAIPLPGVVGFYKSLKRVFHNHKCCAYGRSERRRYTQTVLKR